MVVSFSIRIGEEIMGRAKSLKAGDNLKNTPFFQNEYYIEYLALFLFLNSIAVRAVRGKGGFWH